MKPLAMRVKFFKPLVQCKLFSDAARYISDSNYWERAPRLKCCDTRFWAASRFSYFDKVTCTQEVHNLFATWQAVKIAFYGDMRWLFAATWIQYPVVGTAKLVKQNRQSSTGDWHTRLIVLRRLDIKKRKIPMARVLIRCNKRCDTQPI